MSSFPCSLSSPAVCQFAGSHKGPGKTGASCENVSKSGNLRGSAIQVGAPQLRQRTKLDAMWLYYRSRPSGRLSQPALHFVC